MSDEAPTTARRSRLYDVDRAKGLAILLVVLGHIVPREPPASNEVFMAVKYFLYQFHMAFFMYLSGITFFYSGGSRTTPAKYPSYIRKRAIRLLVPYVAMAVLIVLGKLLASHVVAVDNVPTDFLDGLYGLVWDAQANPAQSIWFIFVLFVYCAAVPILMWLTRNRVWFVLLLSVAVFFIPLPQQLYGYRLGFFFVFFMMGGVLALHLDRYLRLLDATWGLWLALFITAFALFLLPLPKHLVQGVVGALSAPALHGLVRRAPLNSTQVLLFLGGYTFVIYLFNTLAIGLAKGVMFHFMNWDGVRFLFFLPVLFVAGVGGPLLLKFLVIKRVPILDRMTT